MAFSLQYFGNGMEVRMRQKEGRRRIRRRKKQRKREHVCCDSAGMKMSLLCWTRRTWPQAATVMAKIVHVSKQSSDSQKKISFWCSKQSMAILTFTVLPKFPSRYRSAVTSSAARAQVIYGRQLIRPRFLQIPAGAHEMAQEIK